MPSKNIITLNETSNRIILSMWSIKAWGITRVWIRILFVYIFDWWKYFIHILTPIHSIRNYSYTQKKTYKGFTHLCFYNTLKLWRCLFTEAFFIFSIVCNLLIYHWSMTGINHYWNIIEILDTGEGIQRFNHYFDYDCHLILSWGCYWITKFDTKKT